MRAILALEDGTWFEGRSVTGQGQAGGEVIFNTGMTGYQEILTDPSYRGQLVCMTYPHIGNYGVNPDDVESERVQVAGFIVKECCRLPSNWRSSLPLPEYLKQHNIMGLEGIDTRALTRHLRLQGAMRGYIATGESDPNKVVAKARSIPEMEGQNLVDVVTPQSPFLWTADGPRAIDTPERFLWPEDKPKVVVCDCGAKWNIMRRLAKEGFQVVAVPAFYSADRIKALDPDALFLSNGPGDPAALPDLVHTVASLVDAFPIGGICLGHQILGLVLGGSSFKLKFGHHGVNHPVRHLATGKIEITSQNHGFCVSTDGLDDVEQTHINLNDATLEGFVHRKKPIMAVQYHPEAAPGPHDSRFFFRNFAHMVKESLGVAH
jgi:carbamoyl-phosphate synthase small subunit